MITKIIFISVFFAMLICAPVNAALVAEVQGPSLSDSLAEGSEVSFSVLISGIPSQTETLELSTDLIPSGSKAVWKINTASVRSDDSLNERLIHLKTEDGKEFPSSVNISVTGRIPTITTTKTTDGVVINKRPTQRSGYLYYDIKALDADGKTLSAAATGTVTITVSDEVSFMGRANTIEDTDYRTLLTGMYNKGLTDDAWAQLKWYENMSAHQKKPMSVSVPIIVGIIALIVGFAAGFIIATRRAQSSI